MTRILLVLLVLAASLACTKAETRESTTASINATCPGMGDPVDAAAGTYDWNGKQVGFCCEACLPKFAALSDAEKTAALEKVGVKLDG